MMQNKVIFYYRSKKFLQMMRKKNNLEVKRKIRCWKLSKIFPILFCIEAKMIRVEAKQKFAAN
jgi:hypothetical protein